jgi:hypothetical protein
MIKTESKVGKKYLETVLGSKEKTLYIDVIAPNRQISLVKSTADTDGQPESTSTVIAMMPVSVCLMPTTVVYGKRVLNEKGDATGEIIVNEYGIGEPITLRYIKNCGSLDKAWQEKNNITYNMELSAIDFNGDLTNEINTTTDKMKALYVALYQYNESNPFRNTSNTESCEIRMWNQEVEEQEAVETASLVIETMGTVSALKGSNAKIKDIVRKLNINVTDNDSINFNNLIKAVSANPSKVSNTLEAQNKDIEQVIYEAMEYSVIKRMGELVTYVDSKGTQTSIFTDKEKLSPESQIKHIINLCLKNEGFLMFKEIEKSVINKKKELAK